MSFFYAFIGECRLRRRLVYDFKAVIDDQAEFKIDPGLVYANHELGPNYPQRKDLYYVIFNKEPYGKT